MAQDAISAAAITKEFPLLQRRRGSLKELVVGLLRGGDQTKPFAALSNVDFTVPKGQTLGIIGRNGSGKSTLFRLLAGVILPSTGRVQVAGRVAAVIELEAGFHPELTGVENIYLNGAIYGMGRRETATKLDSIIGFADLGEFIDAPIRTYSSGMLARLGFALAIFVDADVLLFDEVLAVGDEAFQARCLDRIDALRGNGKTIIYVSHDMESVRRVCDRVIWLNRGQICADGPPEQVIERYRTFCQEFSPSTPP